MLAGLTLFVLGVFCRASGTGINVEEFKNRVTLQKHIWNSYVRGLDLQGKSGGETMLIMLKEGFSCGVKTHYLMNLTANITPRIECERYPSGYGRLCEELSVTALLTDRKSVPQQEILVKNFDQEFVRGFTSICESHRYAVSQRFLAHEKTATSEVAGRAEILGLKEKSVASAMEILLIDEYFCGFAGELEAKESATAPPKILCRRPNYRPLNRPQIEHCFEERMLLHVDWSEPTATREVLLQDRGRAKVTRIESSCWIPAIEGENSAPL